MKVTLILIATLVFSSFAYAGDAALEETRYCGTPKRTVSGAIVRRSDVLVAFQQIHPCPSTGSTTGSCPGWAKNHIIPLACGGCDSVTNLQWMPYALKSGTGMDVDRWERKIYDRIPDIPGTDACTNVLVPGG